MSHATAIDDPLRPQREHFSAGETLPVEARRQCLRALQGGLRKHETMLIEALSADLGKSAFETFLTELALLHQELALAIRKVGRWSRRRFVWTNLTNLPGRSYVYPEPLGVTLVIGAWNYPIYLTLAPAVSALAAGNTVLLKPSEHTPHTAQAIAELVRSCMDARVASVVQGGPDETAALLEHRFDKVFFTGGQRVGKIVAQAAAKHLTPVTLELGGKSPALVLPDAELKVTARRLAWGKLLNAGQTCVAPDYVLAHHSIKDQLLEHLKQQIVTMHDGPGESYTRIVNAEHFERLTQLITPAETYHTGQHNAESLYLAPTLLDATWESAAMQEEIFGPILPVVGYDDLDAAVAALQARPRPLACYLFTASRGQADRLLADLSFGGGAVNDTVVHLANHRLPFGGVGGSGYGAYHGFAGFQEFSHQKSVLRRPFWGDSPARYPPYEPWKKRLLRRLMG